MNTLADTARRCDETTRRARAELTRAVRDASARGMTQAEIAREIGRSQPEVSRLLRFHGTSALARRLRSERAHVLRAVAEVGGTRVRVFGSVATGRDHPGSDVDLLFHMGTPLSLLELERTEREVSRLIGASVDLVPDDSIAPAFRERVLDEAVPL